MPNAKPSKWRGPMIGRFTLEASFPLPDGGDAREVEKVLLAMLNHAAVAGALPEPFKIHLIETRARPLADEQAYIRAAKNRRIQREGVGPRRVTTFFVHTPEGARDA